MSKNLGLGREYPIYSFTWIRNPSENALSNHPWESLKLIPFPLPSDVIVRRSFLTLDRNELAIPFTSCFNFSLQSYIALISSSFKYVKTAAISPWHLSFLGCAFPVSATCHHTVQFNVTDVSEPPYVKYLVQLPGGNTYKAYNVVRKKNVNITV